MDPAVRARQFAAFHRLDRNFYAAFLGLCWVGALFGFYPATTARMAGHADYPAPLILQFHAILFVSWLLLLTTQILFIRGKRLRLHRSLGRVGYLLAPLMVYSGLAAELYSQRFYLQRDNEDLHFFILPLFYVAAFALFSGLALWAARRDPFAHKRYILLATTIIVGAAYARWWGGALSRIFGEGYWGTLIHTFTGTNLLLAIAVGFDVASRGRPHRVYATFVPLILVAEFACSGIYHADWWVPVARQLIQIRLPLST